MNNFFDLVHQEFFSKMKQATEFITNHNPSIGMVNESILRGFLNDNLPNWVSVEQGFIMDSKGDISNQIDILIFDSTLYSPLYTIYDLVVVPSEAVVAIVEVKTSINKKILHEVIEKNFNTKSICPNIPSHVFIYNPQRLKTVAKHIDNFSYEDFDNIEVDHLPDMFHGMGKFCISKIKVVDKKKEGVSYASFVPYYKEEPNKIAVFENFFDQIYYTVERWINRSLKNGIESSSIINLSKKTYTPKGREKYLNYIGTKDRSMGKPILLK